MSRRDVEMAERNIHQAGDRIAELIDAQKIHLEQIRELQDLASQRYPLQDRVRQLEAQLKEQFLNYGEHPRQFSNENAELEGEIARLRELHSQEVSAWIQKADRAEAHAIQCEALRNS